MRGRSFTFTLPDELPYDDIDRDRILSELGELDPAPDEVQGPVADGLGNLVYSGFEVIYWDDGREDYEILSDIEDAVKRGLKDRVWKVYGHRVENVV